MYREIGTNVSPYAGMINFDKKGEYSMYLPMVFQLCRVIVLVYNNSYHTI